MSDSIVNGFAKFQEYLSGYRDRFVIIGGTAVMMLEADGDAVLRRNARATSDIDMIVLADKVDQPFVNAFGKLIVDGKYDCYHDKKNYPHYYRFERPDEDVTFPSQLELLTENPLPENETFKYASLTLRLDGHLSAIVLDKNYYQFALSCAVDSHGVKALSRLGLVVLKSHAAMNYLKDSREQTDPKKRGIAYDNYKKHRRDVFLLMAGMRDSDSKGIVIPEDIKQTMRDFAHEHSSDFSTMQAIAASIKSSPDQVEQLLAQYSTLASPQPFQPLNLSTPLTYSP